MIGIRRPVAVTRRIAAGVLAAVVSLLLLGLPAEPAGAAITTFTMSPATGEAGTLVHVRGRDCAPGLLGSSRTNFVSVSATTLGVAFRVPVKTDGRWSGSFKVPAGGAGSLSAPAPVTATCVSTGLASLTTIYTPKLFSVTAASPPLIVGDPPPTTGEPLDRTVVIPGDRATVIGVPSTSGPGNGEGIAAQEAARRAVKRNATAPRDSKSRSPEAATLRPAGIGGRSSAGSGAGLGWLGWTLLLVLLAAAVGASGYVWRARHLHDATEGGRP